MFLRWQIRCRTAVLLALIQLPATALAAKPVADITLEIAVDEALAPYSFSCGEGQVQGADIDLLREAAKIAGVRISITGYPWRRVLYMVENGQVALGAPLFQTEERSQFAQFLAPLHQAVPTLFVRKEKLNEYTDLFKLKGKRIGYSRGYALPPELQDAIRNNIVSGDEVGSSRQNMQNLMLQRIDGFIASYASTQFDLRSTPEQSQIAAQPAIRFPGREAFLVSSIAYQPENRAKFDTAVSALKKAAIHLYATGKANQYLQRYLDKNALPPCNP